MEEISKKDRDRQRLTDEQQTYKLTDRKTDRQADRQMDGRMDKQTDSQTNRQTDRQTHRQSDRQTDTQSDRQTDRQTVPGPAEVLLALHHLQKVFASLDESVHLSKDAGLVEDPALGGEGVVQLTGAVIGLLPLLAAVDALLETGRERVCA